MLRWRSTWARLPLLIAVLQLPLPSEAAELYRRAVVLEDRVGRINVRRAYGIHLTVLTDCESDRRGCPAERVYDEVVQIEFIAERREVVHDEIARAESPMGTIGMALAFSDGDLELFRTEMDGRLRRLSAEAFVEPFAGWKPMQAPFDLETLSYRSELSTWACFNYKELSAVARLDAKSSGHTYSKPPTPLCDEMARAVAGAAPQVIETLPAPKRLLESIVYHDDVSRFDGSDQTARTKRPEGVRLQKREFMKGISAEAASTLEGGVDYSSLGTGDGWHFDGFAPATAFPIEAVDQQAWLHHWAIESIDRRFGTRPQDSLVNRTILLTVYLATIPPARIVVQDELKNVNSSEPLPFREVQESPVAGPVKIDREKFLEKIAKRLDHYHGSPQELLEQLVARPEAGLESEGWISVLCRDDGSATYYVLPTKAHNRVINAELFCGALESRLRGR